MGFTLLEMLVVLGIIGVIMAIATSSFSTAQKKARDSRRRSDLKAIQNAVEQYYSVCGYKYPTANPEPTNGREITSVVCLNPSSAILPAVPKDPKSDAAYVYTSEGSFYTLCIPTRVATPPIFESESGTTPFCITNQQ